MQRNKIVTGILATVVLTTATVFGAGGAAQAKGGGPGKGHKDNKNGKTLEKYAAELGLTRDQKARISQVMASVKTEREKVKNNASLTPDARRMQSKQIAKNASERIKAILTPAQEAKIKELRRAARERRGATAGGAGRTTKPGRGGGII